jgi:hypothetical protein
MAGAPAAYDAIADRFGGFEAENRVLALMRARSLAVLFRTMPSGGRLLELGAGAGTEAVAVSEAKGGSIVAVEPAAGLAAIIKQKAAAAGLPIEVRVATASVALKALHGDAELFDGAWSSFAIGYDAPLEVLQANLAAVLPPNAPLVLTLRNPWCLAAPWSIPQRARGRYLHKVGEARVPIRHYSRRAAADALSAGFDLVKWQAVPVLVPPPRAGALWNKLGPLATAIERLDALVAPRAPFNSLGDHTLFEFRRR